MSDIAERKARFLAEMEKHGKITRAAQAAGVSKQAVAKWAKNDSAFADELARMKRVGHGKPRDDDLSIIACRRTIADPNASPNVKLRAVQEIRKIIRPPAHHRTQQQEPPAPSKGTLELIDACRRDAVKALDAFPSSDLLAPELRSEAEAFLTMYNSVFAGRGILISKAPHLIPVALALVEPALPNVQIIIGPGSGKSLMVSVAWPLYALAKDPSAAILQISAGEDLVTSFVAEVAHIIDANNAYRALHPHVLPDKARGWSIERGLFIKGRAAGGSDPSVFATGIGSSTITGRHATLIIMDDIHDAQNSLNADACDRVQGLFYKQILGRADPRGARFIVTGRRWSLDDLYAHFGAGEQWVTFTLPAERARSRELGNRLWHDVSADATLIDRSFLAPFARLPDALASADPSTGSGDAPDDAPRPIFDEGPSP